MDIATADELGRLAAALAIGQARESGGGPMPEPLAARILADAGKAPNFTASSAGPIAATSGRDHAMLPRSQRLWRLAAAAGWLTAAAAIVLARPVPTTILRVPVEVPAPPPRVVPAEERMAAMLGRLGRHR
jgi:hypothetical protein